MNQLDYGVAPLINDFQVLVDLRVIHPKYQVDIDELKKLNERVNSFNDKIKDPFLSKKGLDMYLRKIAPLEKEIHKKISKLWPQLQSKEGYNPRLIENEEMDVVLQEIDKISLEIESNKERLKKTPELTNEINIIIAELTKRKAILENNYNNLSSGSELLQLELLEKVESLGGKVDRSKLVSLPKLEVSAIPTGEIRVKKGEERKIIKKYFKNPEEFFNSMKNARQNDPQYIKLAEQKLLQIDANNVKGKDNQKDSKNNKAWKKRKNLICAQYKIDSNNLGAVSLVPSMMKWETDNLVDISSWGKYCSLNNEEQKQQIIAHTVGIGVHPLLNDENLRYDYTWDADEGFYMSCLVNLKDSNKIFGKIHFILDEENRVFHRMFFQASPDVELEKFLAERGDLEEALEESLEDLSKVAKETIQNYSYQVHEDGNIEYTLANNSFVKSYTIFNYNR